MKYAGSMLMMGPEQSGHLNKDQLRQLISGFERADFGALPDEIRPDDKYNPTTDCPAVAPNFPDAETSISAGGVTKKVRHYLGCHGSTTSNSIENLENTIDEITKTEQWISKFRWSPLGVGLPVDFP